MSKPSGTNSPTSSSVCGLLKCYSGMSTGMQDRAKRISQEKRKQSISDSERLGSLVTERRCPDYLFSETYCGGYSGEDPPLPIPNREVKLTIADGTAPPGGRVGSYHFLIQHPVIIQ